MCSGVDSDSHSVLKSVSNSPAPRSWDSRMMEENDIRYRMCPISSAMVSRAPLMTCSVMGSSSCRVMVSSPQWLRRMRRFPCAETSQSYAGGTRIVELCWMRIAGPEIRCPALSCRRS